METLFVAYHEVIDFLSEISWSMILGICVGGGLLAYIGDKVGMKFAKKRVTIFGLRPRSTSSIITALTGMVISLGVMAALAVTSETVRTALFSMKFLEKQTTDLTTQLQASRQEQELSALLAVETQEKLDKKETELKTLQVQAKQLTDQIEPMKKERDSLAAQTTSLRGELTGLKKTLSRFQEGRIVAVAGERLGQRVVPDGATADQVRQIVSELQESVRYEIARRSGATPDQVILKVPSSVIDGLVSRCTAIASRKVIRVSADVNIVAGEAFTPVFRVFETELIYHKGESILQRQVPQAKSSDSAEGELSAVLGEVNHLAASNGVLTDPLTGTVGDISATEFFSVAKDMTAIDGPVQISIRAAQDIYSEGPVRVDIDVTKDEGVQP